MSEQTAGIGEIELRIMTAHGKKNTCFWHEGQGYRTIHLDGGCDNILIGEWEESICAWAILEVVDAEKSPRIELRTNLAASKSRAVLERMVSEANAAIRSGRSRAVDMTDELQLMGWNVCFSNDATPR